MPSSSQQPELLPAPLPLPGNAMVNHHVSFQTEGKQRVILVHGICFSNYSVADRAAEAYGLVSLFEAGYADQNDIARCFGYSTRTLRRYQQRLRAGGLSALARPQGRPPARAPVPKKIAERDRTILRLKAKEHSNRWIAGRLGLSEKTVRKTLRRLGWKPGPEPSPLPLPLVPEVSDCQAQPDTASAAGNQPTQTPSAPPPSASSPPTPVLLEPVAKSLDLNPLDRSMDRLLAAMGLLDDAPPVFASVQNLPRAGV